jgi:hypothetical protein
MWEQYKKTFLGMQVVIALVSVAMYLFLTRAFLPTLTFFLVLQAGAVAGAQWGAQLRKRFKAHG